MDKWALQMNNEIDEKLSATKDRDLRFFRIEELKRNVERTGRFAHNCATCTQFKVDIESVVYRINEAVNVPGQYRRDLDRLVSRLSGHMSKAHGFYPPFYFNYHYSFYGMVAGAAIGFAGMKLLPSTHYFLLASCFIAGLLIGQIAGGLKDGKIRNDDRLM